MNKSNQKMPTEIQAFETQSKENTNVHIDLANNIDTPNDDAKLKSAVISPSQSSAGLFCHVPFDSFVPNDAVRFLCKTFLLKNFNPKTHGINGQDYLLYQFIETANNDLLLSLVQNKNGSCNKMFQVNLSHTCEHETAIK